MARTAATLSAKAVEKLTRPGLHAVGGVPGLCLQILPTKSRSWILRATMPNGRRREMGLGGFPAVSLAEARERARTAREAIRGNADPIEDARRARSALRASSARAMTFKAAAAAYMDAHSVAWRNAKHAQQWASTLENYAYPVIGDLSVEDIEAAHVLKILEPIWTAKNETATRLRGRIETVLDWATARGYRKGDNPARWRGHLSMLLAKPGQLRRVKPIKHHKAIPVSEIGAFMRDLRQVEGIGARALEFVTLTACRSGEARGATWAEIDLTERVWTIPGERMKAGVTHRVPLSDRAVELLKSLPRMAGTDMVFPAPRTGGTLSDMTLAQIMRRMDAPGVPHGMRSTFRDWAAERTNYPRDIAEAALAHTIENKAERAYKRSDVLKKRARMMQDWANFIAKPEARGGDNVTAINAKVAAE